MKETGLYIHIPYCKSKCIYCDFFSGGASSADWEIMILALLQELKERKSELVTPPDTIYIGGGTPSLIPSNLFIKLIEGIRDEIGYFKDFTEFTIEVNPEDVCHEKCAVWKECGVNRVSMGVQSFIDSELKAVRRRHDAKSAIEAYDLLKRYFGNVSIDLMFGLPGQTHDSWKFSVEKALELNPEHISAYSLMFEEGTPISVLRERNLINIPSDEDCVGMWSYLSSVLFSEDYMQYEISNYCKIGFVSIHNSRYWLGNPYVGLGPSAHSYDGFRIRRANPKDLKGYLSRFGSWDVNLNNFYVEEYLNDEELSEEMILTRMRMKKGLPITEYQNRFGSDASRRLLKNARPYIDKGLLKEEEGCLRLTDKSIMISDEVILALSI